MLVYGDPEREQNPRDILTRLETAVRSLALMPAGIERHAALVAAFIEAGELVQGIADAAFADEGWDAPSPAQDAAMMILMEFAHAVRRSWSTGFATVAALSPESFGALSALPLPPAIRTKVPEGYAFYALYPEAYLAAARTLEGREPTRVIGIRSIGTGLAALVAAELGAPPPRTVRPGGHPFERSLALSPALSEELLSDPTARIAVVDEGPGLSGSSFGAVADWLEDGGVVHDNIHFFPGHAGDLGPQASSRHRERWRRAARHVVEFDALALGGREPGHRLETWVRDLVGEPDGPLEDISGGAWRKTHFSTEAEWPAAHVQQERRKFLLRAGGTPWLLKFAGLGHEGARKLDRARMLHRAGFTPEALGYRHGFLVERWIEGARPLAGVPADQAGLAERVGRYLGFRARHFPAGSGAGAPRGASLETLLAMAVHNTAQALGPKAAQSLSPWAGGLPRLERRARRIETDNRMQAWEWLVFPDGRILKTDALDHHAAHDLVGCQDVAWDVAGATVELGLDAVDRARLLATVEAESGRPVDPELLAFLTLCYLAFQLGHHGLAAEALTGWPEEAARLRQAFRRYGERLQSLLERESPTCNGATKSLALRLS